MRNVNRLLIFTALAALNVFLNVNCSSQGQAGNANTAAAATNTTTATTVIVSASSYTVNTNGSLQVSASGGTAPYTYNRVSGSGTVDLSTGWFTANSTTGPVVIQATDAKGLTGQIALSVVYSATSNPSTEYGCDDVVPVQITQTCTGAHNGTCSINASYYGSVPSGCKVTQVNVYAKHFNGNPGGSCSYDAALGFTTTSTQQAQVAGNGKSATMTVSTDLANRTITISSAASGWGTCGGSPCNACVSDVRLELKLQTL